MKGTEFANYIRKRTKTDATSFDNDAILVYANAEQEQLASRVIKRNDSMFERQATTSLVAGQREYAFPTDMMVGLKIVEISLDGTNWRRAYPFDINEYRKQQESQVFRKNVTDIPASFSTATTDEDTITEFFSDDYPMYDIAGGTMKFFTSGEIIDVTGGIKISYTQYPRDITAADIASEQDLSSPEPSAFRMPREIHKAWAMTVVTSYKNDNEIPLNSEEQALNSIIERSLSALAETKKDIGGVIPVRPRDDGYNY